VKKPSGGTAVGAKVGNAAFFLVIAAAKGTAPANPTPASASEPNHLSSIEEPLSIPFAPLSNDCLSLQSRPSRRAGCNRRIGVAPMRITFSLTAIADRPYARLKVPRPVGTM